MFEECAPPIPVVRLLGCSGFGNAVGSVKASASNVIQEIMFLGGCLMWNDATVYGGRFWLNIYVSVWSDMWNSCDRDSAMIFSVPLICCEYRDVSLLMRAQPIQWSTLLCDSAFTGSKDALLIQLSELELSANAKMCEPCTSCWILMYIDIFDANNSNRFSVSFP